MSLCMCMWSRMFSATSSLHYSSKAATAAYPIKSRLRAVSLSVGGRKRGRRKTAGHQQSSTLKRCCVAAAFPSTVVQDAGAAVVVMGGALSLVRAFDALTEREIIDQKLSRKAVHVLSGVLFMCSWSLFSSSMEARYFAAVTPLLNCFRLIISGLSFVNNEELVKSVTRGGKPKELLRGPLYYVIVLLLCVLLFWRDSPIGIVSLAMMSGGDGFADIVGRKFGATKLPFNDQKSWAGSIAMFLSGFSLSLLMLYYYSSLGFLDLDWRLAAGKVAVVSLAATAVESLPISEIIDDNISVPFTSMLTALLVFGSRFPI